MINICIKDIVEATKGKLLCGDEKQQIDHLSIDSRSSQGNDLFIPIIGAKVDAHRFIDGAFSVGCVATLTSEHDSMDDPNHAWIRVEDTVLALHEIGKLCRSRVTVACHWRDRKRWKDNDKRDDCLCAFSRKEGI